MHVREFRSSDLDAIRSLLLDAGWRERAEDRGRLAEIVAAASAALVAEIDDVVVGFGRAVTDGVSNGYLSMLVVSPVHRRRGIGSALVEALVGDDARLTWVLRAGIPESVPFWEALGFRRSEIAFERPRSV
jgi:GNAT superfamily N-acetyltransferase